MQTTVIHSLRMSLRKVHTQPHAHTGRLQL